MRAYFCAYRSASAVVNVRLCVDARVQKYGRAKLLLISHTTGAHAAAHMWCALWVLQSPPISTNNLFIRYLRRRNVVVNHRCMVVVKMVSQMQRALFLKAAQLYLNRNVIYLQLPGLVTITLRCGFMM